jgi:hypothetical protein
MRLPLIHPSDLDPVQRALYDDMRAGIATGFDPFQTALDDGTMIGSPNLPESAVPPLPGSAHHWLGRRHVGCSLLGTEPWIAESNESLTLTRAAGELS